MLSSLVTSCPQGILTTNSSQSLLHIFSHPPQPPILCQSHTLLQSTRVSRNNCEALPCLVSTNWIANLAANGLPLSRHHRLLSRQTSGFLTQQSSASSASTFCPSLLLVATGPGLLSVGFSTPTTTRFGTRRFLSRKTVSEAIAIRQDSTTTDHYLLGGLPWVGYCRTFCY